MIFGHKKNLKIFSTYLSKGNFPQAVLFSGPIGIGKRKIANLIAKYVEIKHSENFFEFSRKECLCETCQSIEKGRFPDVFEIKKEKEKITIKEIREIKKKFSLSSLYPYKIAIINNVELLTREASGALLKTLEEPKGNTIFFLLTSMPNILEKTVLSRMEIFKFYSFSRKEIEEFLRINGILKKDNKENFEKIVDFSFGRPGFVKNLLIDKKKLFYYNRLIDSVEKIKRSSIIQRLKEAEKIEKNGEIEDFFLVLELWLRDLILKKNKSRNITFKVKENGIESQSKEFKEIELINKIKTIQNIKNSLLFSNANKLLGVENAILEI